MWDDMDVAAASSGELRQIRRQIGMIFQHFNLVHRSSVLTNVLAGRLGYINPIWSVINRFLPEISMAQWDWLYGYNCIKGFA